MLTLTNVTAGYGRVTAIGDVSLHVAAGEAVALIGPNGAGKTTTLSVIAGLLRPASGSVSFDGVAIPGRKPESLVQAGISMVPEGRQILTTLTVEENLRVPAAGLSTSETRARIDRELERFPVLAEKLRHPAGGLSGGQQQQLAIARSLISRPRLLLLDEPSLGLAPLLVDAVFATLEELNAEGVTILLVEQNAVRASRFADRTYVLNAGRVVLEATRDELDDIDLLTESYLGSARQEATPQ